MGDPPANEEAESARARSEGGSDADDDLEDYEIDSDEETDVDSDDDMVCSRPCRDACTRRTRAPHAPPGGEAPPLGHPPRPPHAQPAKTHALYPSRFACRARPPAPAPAVHTRAFGPAHSRLGRAQSRPAPPHLPPPTFANGGVYSPSLRSRAVRLPPTPCRVCFRPCVFNKFSHF